MSLSEGVYASISREVSRPDQGWQSHVRSWFRSSVLTLLATAARQPASKFLRCLYCHSVFDDQKHSFSHALASLQRIGSFVSASTCVSIIRGELPLDGRYFHLSFDDGFRNVFRNAYPTIRALGIPATVFVPTAYIGSDWTSAREYSLSRVHYAVVLELMNWEDLGEMAASGVEIGSHTRTHRRLAELTKDPSVLWAELAGSKHEVEHALKVKCDYLSWPYGTGDDIFDGALSVAKAVGYAGVFSAVRGQVLPGKTDPYRIPRHHFEASWPTQHLAYVACHEFPWIR